MNETEQELRQQLLRVQCRADDLERGWSNCSQACTKLQDQRDTARRERDEAAARIRALEERLTAPPVQRGTTHWEDCWKDRGHHACAVAAVERLQSDIAAARALPVKWRSWADKIFRAEPANRIRDCANDLDAALPPTVSEGVGEGG